MTAFWIIAWLLAMTVLAFQRASLSVWTIGMGVFLVLCSAFSSFHFLTLSVFWLIYAGIFIILNVRSLRRQLLSSRIFAIYKKIMPSLSDT